MRLQRATPGLRRVIQSRFGAGGAAFCSPEKCCNAATASIVTKSIRLEMYRAIMQWICQRASLTKVELCMEAPEMEKQLALL